MVSASSTHLLPVVFRQNTPFTDLRLIQSPPATSGLSSAAQASQVWLIHGLNQSIPKKQHNVTTFRTGISFPILPDPTIPSFYRLTLLYWWVSIQSLMLVKPYTTTDSISENLRFRLLHQHSKNRLFETKPTIPYSHSLLTTSIPLFPAFAWRQSDRIGSHRIASSTHQSIGTSWNTNKSMVSTSFFPSNDAKFRFW